MGRLGLQKRLKGGLGRVRGESGGLPRTSCVSEKLYAAGSQTGACVAPDPDIANWKHLRVPDKAARAVERNIKKGSSTCQGGQARGHLQAHPLVRDIACVTCEVPA